jgi:hypothetical protein
MLEKSKEFIAYFGINQEEAEKIFKELYPFETSKDVKRAKSLQASQADWSDSSLQEIESTLALAFSSRHNHASSIENGFDSPALLQERQKQISNAKKLLLEWTKHLSDDLDTTKEISNPISSSANSEISKISKNVQNMVRLLLEFSDQYSESVRRVRMSRYNVH